jgi:NAD(P)-dependent dehydrogenase (short-subunit alcohol dehydrogenase family)
MKDRVVVITGASAGIGAALAELAGQRGACVALVARREREIREVAARSGPQALPIVADVTRRDELTRVAETAISRFGHVDVLVNNAGRGITRSVADLSDEDFDEMMQVNVKAALYGMQAFLPHFRARGRGHFVNVSSMLGRVPLVPLRSAYSASKAALNLLAASLRMELSTQYPRIIVSCVHPGIVATAFGTNARHGGPDSRQMPGAQPAAEVAGVIAELMENPRADVYTRPGAREMVASYYAAEDMARVEQEPPFVRRAAPRTD